MTSENRCKYCNKILIGVTPCNCEKSKKYFNLWNKKRKRKQVCNLKKNEKENNKKG